MSSDAGLQIAHVHSRDNPLVKLLRRLARHNTAYRKQGQIWVEGDHLCRAALQRGLVPVMAIFAESFWATAGPAWRADITQVVVVPDTLFDEFSSLESPARIGFVLDLPTAGTPHAGAPSVVLDRVQDAGNVGSILRSAGAFGFRQVLALSGTAALWSPKVLRAGMGAHFGLHLVEGLSVPDVVAIGVPLVVTSSHRGALLHAQVLPWPCAWAFGHEGQGVNAALAGHADTWCRIAQPGGEESLNVAAAAAICLHASAVGQRS
ncbi:MAG: RNA methyltransferase [Betaproteobacteria bacterium]